MDIKPTSPPPTYKRVGNNFDFVFRDDIFSIISWRPLRQLTMHKKSWRGKEFFFDMLWDVIFITYLDNQLQDFRYQSISERK